MFRFTLKKSGVGWGRGEGWVGVGLWGVGDGGGVAHGHLFAHLALTQAAARLVRLLSDSVRTSSSTLPRFSLPSLPLSLPPVSSHNVQSAVLSFVDLVDPTNDHRVDK